MRSPVHEGLEVAPIPTGLQDELEAVFEIGREHKHGIASLLGKAFNRHLFSHLISDRRETTQQSMGSPTNMEEPRSTWNNVVNHLQESTVIPAMGSGLSRTMTEM
ncbi:hypothetical protein BGZ65_010981, partial [Modicella reniformis]